MRGTRLSPTRCAAAAAALLSSVVLVACGSAEPAGSTGGPEVGRVAFFTDALSNSYLRAAVDASTALAAQEGVEMDVFSADWDTNKQITQVQDAISSGRYSAYVVEAIDGQALCRPLTAAAKDGAVVSIYNTPICGNVRDLYTPGTVGYFGRLEYMSGQLFADTMAKALPNGGRIAYVSGPPQNSIVREITTGLHDTLAKYPNLQLVAEVSGEWDAAKGLAATQDVVAANPDLDGIVFGDDGMAVSAVRWLQETGRTGIATVSLGSSSTAVDMVENGQMVATVAGLPVEESTRSLQAAIQTMRGQPVDVPGWDPATKTYNVLRDPVFAGGAPVIDASNAAGFTSAWSV